MEILKSPQGQFRLSRYPIRKKEQLRAWDAADEYLLNYFNEKYGETAKPKKILIINDSFGALATSFADHHVTFWNDSLLAQEGLLRNFSNNGLPTDNIRLYKSVDVVEGLFDYVLIKIPKSSALLEDQLIKIKANLSSSSRIIAAGMAKSIHTSTLKLFEKYIGKTTTSLAKKKARLIFCELDETILKTDSPYPKKYILENTDYTIFNHANVFSRENLDIGTRFFLQYIPKSEKYKTIIDLGCGNGVVGLIAAEKNPDAELVFLDVSFMAVESARETFELAFNQNRKVRFQANDCLSGVEKNSVDLILNNPPFHQDNVVGDNVAWTMFNQSKAVLKKNGELFVIGNRHLAYHIKLKKIFGNCEVIANNKKFVILKAVNLS